jgi:Protein of unknown function (DUF5818)
MQNAKAVRLLQTLGLLMFALSWAHALVPQQDRNAATPETQQQQAPDTINQQQTGASDQLHNATTFSGKVTKSGDQFVLQDGVGEIYQLDDQGKAKHFEGKNVKVTGRVEEVTETIHVAKIEAEP